jgi:molybdopterin-guanine dinucleotide biosynthesis protein A
MPRSDMTGFILAGGRSTRMGRDKAQIFWGRGTLLSHACEQMRKIVSETYIVGRIESPDARCAVLSDTFLGRGPLAGIHSALKHTETDWNLVLALDLPLVSSALLEFVAKACGDPNQAVAIRVGDHLQPLCAAYHRCLLWEIEARLHAGELSIHCLFEAARTRIIEEKDLLSAGFGVEMLLNVNTPEDLERAKELAKTLHVE